MQYRIKFRPYLVFYTLELNKGMSVLMSSEVETLIGGGNM